MYVCIYSPIFNFSNLPECPFHDSMGIINRQYVIKVFPICLPFVLNAQVYTSLN